MPYARFLVFNAAGGLVWGVSVGLLGYFAASSYEQVHSMLGRAGAVLFIALGVTLLVVLHLRRRSA